jgi:hypothetical protein
MDGFPDTAAAEACDLADVGGGGAVGPGRARRFGHSATPRSTSWSSKRMSVRWKRVGSPAERTPGIPAAARTGAGFRNADASRPSDLVAIEALR